MGLFGKKKTKVENNATGSYAAPSVGESSAAGQDGSNHSDEDLVRVDLPTVAEIEAQAASIGENTPDTPKKANLGEQQDVEQGVAAAETTSVSLMPNPYSPDEATLEAPQVRTYDDPSVYTQRTNKSSRSTGTSPTVKTAESGESRDSAFTITRNGEYLTLNGFANGHLMRWKFASEEGPTIIRLPAVLLALGVIGTTIYPLVCIPAFWTIPNIICATHTIVLSFLILVLEGRVVGVRSPTNVRARVRGVLTRYINLLRLLWGRGLLYIFAGSMNLTSEFDKVLYSAIPMMVLGVLAIGSGAHASYNLDKMKCSLTDEAFLWSKFEGNHMDKDNMIELEGFAELLWSLGLEFDDVYTYKAFQQIDRNCDGKISFGDFKDWWIVTQNEGRKLRGRDE